MPKVSIVMPIYNAENYLERSLYSLASQTLTDIEIILIDDGSTDSSPEICDKYADLDSRIKVVHSQNSGMGASYNKGMDLASGKYIGFLESDDKAEKYMFEDLYELAEKNNVDIVKSAWFNYYAKRDCSFKDEQLTIYNSYEIFNIFDKPDILNYQFSVWSAIYKTDFLRENSIRFLETPGASYQDVAFTYKALCLAKNMVFTPNAYVHYTLDNENSSINSKGKANAIFEEYNEVDKFLSKHENIKNCVNSAKLNRQLLDYKWNLNRIDEIFKPEFLKRYSKDFKRYKKNGEMDFCYIPNANDEVLKVLLTI